MTTCEHCGTPIVAGERMVAHMDDGPVWNAQGVLVTPQPMSYVPYHERCFKAMSADQADLKVDPDPQEPSP